MRVRAAPLAIAAVLLGVPRPSAAGLDDACYIRAIDDTGAAVRVAIDVDRAEVETQLRANMPTATSGATIKGITWRVVDPTTLGVDVDFGLHVSALGGHVTLDLTGQVSMHVTATVVGTTTVQADLFLDRLTFQGNTQPLGGARVAGFSHGFALPWPNATLRTVTVVSVDYSWISIVVEAT